jgi:hypothetical protein
MGGGIRDSSAKRESTGHRGREEGEQNNRNPGRREQE